MKEEYQQEKQCRDEITATAGLVNASSKPPCHNDAAQLRTR